MSRDPRHRPPPPAAEREAACRELAAATADAVRRHSGFVVVTGIPPHRRRHFAMALREAASPDFEAIAMAPRERPAAAGAATAATESAPKPALFLIDDADGYGLADLRRLCDAAPFASDWAAMLSVHAVLVTRFAVPQLDFLQSRVAAVLSWPEPPEPLFAPGSASGLAGDFALGPVAADRVFADAIERARFAPALASVLQSLWQRARPADPRRCAMLGYVAAIGALAACFLALQSGGGVDWKAAFGLGP